VNPAEDLEFVTRFLGALVIFVLVEHALAITWLLTLYFTR